MSWSGDDDAWVGGPDVADRSAERPASFLERVGTDEQCRRYLFEARWPEGFRCAGCGHERAWAHKARLVDECAACGKQHSLLAGTIFEQTKTGLARWFLAIYLVTSSQGGISAMELKRQMGLPGSQRRTRWSARSGKGSYQTAWSWLHEIRKAVVAPLAARVEAEETYLGGARPATDGWSGRAGLAARGYVHEPLNLSASWGDAALRLPAIHLASASPSAGCSAPATARSPESACRPTSTSSCSASTAAPPGTSATVSPA